VTVLPRKAETMGSARPLIGGIFLVLAAGLTTNSRASSPQPLHHRLRTTIDDAVTGKGLPSVVVVLLDEHHILWSHAAGYADVATRRSPTLTTRYRLGSMAKAVTSTVLAIAAQKHLISFHSRLPVRAATGFVGVTVEQAVNMQAGLAQAVCYDGITGNSDPSCRSGFDRHFAVAITDGKGRYSYSNMGPQVAADMLAHKLREPFEHIARRLLFRPANMAEATYDHLRPGRDQATSYDPMGKPYAHDFRILPEAGAGFEASAQDLVRFGQLHLGGRAPDGRRLLSERTLSLLHSAPNGGFYGYGWGRIGANKPTEVLIADGQVNGGQAMLILSPRRHVGAIVLSNAAHDEVSALALAGIDAVAPGIAAAFAADVSSMQSAHEAKSSAYFPPGDFVASGFVRVHDTRLPLDLTSRANRLSATIAGETSETVEWSTDEGFRVWSLPCPMQIPDCARPGATAKIFLSRDSSGLGGQLQVTGFNGQVPFALRLKLR
jgi:CubicO group peptidase (beta-lactamase class C family)